MALIHCGFFSYSLGLQVNVDVILPQAGPDAPGKPGSGQLPDKLAALYLLHGMSDDQTIWQRRTSVERYAEGLPLAIIMPAGFISSYVDMYYGFKFFTYITEELPSVMESFFPISNKREDRFIAGLSMGGGGALRCGLRCPDKYAALATLSGGVDPLPRVESAMAAGKDSPQYKQTLSVFGPLDKIAGSENDIFAVARKQIAAGVQLPKIYQACGKQDFLIDSNQRFNAEFGQALGIKYIEDEGTHEWGYWDRHIKSVLEWLPIRDDL